MPRDGRVFRRKKNIHKFYKKTYASINLNNLLEIIKFLQSMPSEPLKYMFFCLFWDVMLN